MNDDLPPSSNAGPAYQSGTAPAGPSQEQRDPSQGHRHAARRRKKFNKHRSLLLADLVRQLDLLIFAELSIIYYMDTYFLFILIRATQHFVFLTPHPPTTPEPPFQPSQRFILLSTTFSTALALWAHIALPAPSAATVTRGYLHGGIVTDFIGQKGPSSKVHLVLLDLLVWILQLVMLEALGVMKRAETLAGLRTGPGRVGGINGAVSLGDLEALMVMRLASSDPDNLHIPSAATEQTVDFEERGEHADDFRPEDVELRELNGEGRGREAEDAEHEEHRRRDDQILDAFGSGEVVIADINPLRFMGRLWADFVKASRSHEPLAVRLQRRIEGVAWRQRLYGQARRASR